MEKVLIAVDDSNSSRAILSAFNSLVRPPESIVLLHVQRLEGNSLMIDMLGDAEMSTLTEALKCTEHKESLDKKAETILVYYKKELENGDLIDIQTVLREGNPVEEILKVAEEENVDLILLGGKRKSRLEKLVSGDVARDIKKNAKVPVLVAKTAGKKAAGALVAMFLLTGIAAGVYFSTVYFLKFVSELFEISVLPSTLVYSGILATVVIFALNGAILGWVIGHVFDRLLNLARQVPGEKRAAKV